MREIETKRLFLRKLRKDDAESIFRNWASDSEVAKYVTWSAHKDITVSYTHLTLPTNSRV